MKKPLPLRMALLSEPVYLVEELAQGLRGSPERLGAAELKRAVYLFGPADLPRPPLKP